MTYRLYVDTSVIGGCEDEEFSSWSRRLFEDFRNGRRVAVVSDLTRQELEGAPAAVKAVLASIPLAQVENVFLSPGAESLARRYLSEGVVDKSHLADAQHIAIATLARVDVLVSWNFRHIVNLQRIRGYNGVNLKLGLPLLEIRSPREVCDEEEV